MTPKDFSFSIYRKLITKIQGAAFEILPVRECWLHQEGTGAFGILRHDVDRRSENALKMAFYESSFGIHATYYFRITKKVFQKEIIKKISKLGHEIGYH